MENEIIYKQNNHLRRLVNKHFQTKDTLKESKWKDFERLARTLALKEMVRK